MPLSIDEPRRFLSPGRYFSSRKNFSNRKTAGEKSIWPQGGIFFSVLLLSALGFARQGEVAPDLDVPFVPTPFEVVDRMLEMAEVKPDDYLIDLGSGDGRIVVSAVRDWNVRAALGIDLDPQRVAEARASADEA